MVLKIIIVLFQKKKGVKIIAVGIGNNIDKGFMNRIVGTKGKVILLKNFNALTARIGQILDMACGKWYNPRQAVVIDILWNRDS